MDISSRLIDIWKRETSAYNMCRRGMQHPGLLIFRNIKLDTNSFHCRCSKIIIPFHKLWRLLQVAKYSKESIFYFNHYFKNLLVRRSCLTDLKCLLIYYNFYHVRQNFKKKCHYSAIILIRSWLTISHNQTYV